MKYVMRLTKNERKELLNSTQSVSLRNDMQYLSANKLNPTLVNGKVDMDKLVDFLTQYNEFINHNPRPFKKIIDKDMKL